MKNFKKGQNWSLELIVVLMLFVIIITISFVYLTYSPENSSIQMRDTSIKIIDLLEKDVGLIRDNQVDNFALSNIESLSSSDLADLLGVSGTVCIAFRDLDGNLIILDNGNLTIGADGEFVCN